MSAKDFKVTGSVTMNGEEVYSGTGHFNNSTGDIKVDGVSNIGGGDYETIDIDGVCNCHGDLKAKQLHIDGVFNCDGQVDTGLLDCEGTTNFKGDIRCEKANINGVLDIKGRFEATTIVGEGVIHCLGEVSADLLDMEGWIMANEVVGERIVIRSKVKRWLSRWLTKKETIGLIEATTVELHGVRARQVNGHDVHIGKGCEIDQLSYSGTLRVDPGATVGSTTNTAEEH
jgi:cytoskeletal protein CcmA (bactofilin family)